jgi:hypothetical protein
MFKQIFLFILFICIFAGTPAVSADNTNMYIVQDKYGNNIGTVKKVGNTYFKTNKNGNIEKTYQKINNTIYIYDKNGNYIGSVRK